MDLKIAIQKHSEWKFKFREALFSGATLDASAIAKDNQCEMGKWLHGEAHTLYAQKGAYERCLAHHAAFHREAGKVAAAINAKKTDEAEKMLLSGSAFSESSKNVSLSIVELTNEIGR